MARRKRSRIEEAPRRSSGRADPFPSSPTRPPKFGIYAWNPEGLFCYETFYAEYAAKRFIEALVGDDYRWLNHQTILGANGVKVSTTTSTVVSRKDDESSDLEDIIEYEMNAEEEEWEPPVPYLQRWMSFASRMPSYAVPSTRPIKTERPRRVEGAITIGAIAEELGLAPSKARAILRSAQVEKPAAGWEWSADDAEKIKKLLRP